MNILQCEYCGEYHDGSYGSGRFCSPKCARKYSNKFVTEEGRASQIKALNDPVNREKCLKSTMESKIKRAVDYRNDIDRQIAKESINIKKINAKKYVQTSISTR